MDLVNRQPAASPVSPAQAAEWSLGGSLAVAFPKSRATTYETALHAAKQADKYSEGQFGKQLVHVAAFGTSRQQIALALYVMKELRYSKGLQVFGGGKFVQDKWRVHQVLECFLSASACSDPRAHCVVIVEEFRLAPQPFDHKMTFYISTAPAQPAPKVAMREFPCRLLYQRGFKFQENHPSSGADQIEAGAVREGCDWCPNLGLGKNRLVSPSES